MHEGTDALEPIAQLSDLGRREGEHEVAVKPGDIIVAGAVSATQQNLVEGRRDVYHAFGGNRRVTGHPTHSCPGAHPALEPAQGE